ncbi:uncharacterized protein LOC134853296 [Symsagittifera roscoffensis]|uniref:uncharacterized protein LOC134853296 n=1 Tax=Symsagittifera roscoffensis TaxID=84072 RepID=UPI00307B559F
MDVLKIAVFLFVCYIQHTGCQQLSFSISCFACVGSESDATLSYCLDTPEMFNKTLCAGSCQTVTAYQTGQIVSINRRCLPTCSQTDTRTSRTGTGVLIECCAESLCNMAASLWKAGSLVIPLLLSFLIL